MNVDANAALYRNFFSKIVQNDFFTLDEFENLETISLLKDKYGFTLLHRASANDRKEIACALIKSGSNLEERATDYWTPLHLACVSSSENCVEVLIDAGSDINAIDKNGNTPLHLSVISRNQNIIQLLINAGVNKNIKNANNFTPYEKAANLELTDIMDSLR